MSWRRIGVVSGCTVAAWLFVGLGAALQVAVDYARLNRATRRAEQAHEALTRTPAP